MKTDVEELSPTRVKLSVEVPFDELKPSIDKAYREVARQVRIPGFRPGRVPPRIIDQRVGRAPVLEQAVNDAIPELYGKAVEQQELFALGRPEVEITSLDDGKELAFTAEFDIRPKFDLPDLGGISVTIDNATVTPDDVEEYLSNLRERFASLKGVQRPAESGDYVSIDLSATVDGEPVEDAQASGLSYEVGSGSMLEGLDDAVTGMSQGESKTFSTELAGGERAGDEAEVTVTVHSVKVKELPDFDDDFAQLASEFDTIGELRADTRRRLEAMRQQQQAIQARDRALETLLDQVDVPLPDSIVEEEAHRLEHSMHDQIERAGADWGTYLQMVGKSQEEFSADLHDQARRSVKTGLVLDQVAKQEDLGVNDGRAVLLRHPAGRADGGRARRCSRGRSPRAARSAPQRPRCCAARPWRCWPAGCRSRTRRATSSTTTGCSASTMRAERVGNADSEAEAAAEEAEGAAEATRSRGPRWPRRPTWRPRPRPSEAEDGPRPAEAERR